MAPRGTRDVTPPTDEVVPESLGGPPNPTGRVPEPTDASGAPGPGPEVRAEPTIPSGPEPGEVRGPSPEGTGANSSVPEGTPQAFEGRAEPGGASMGLTTGDSLVNPPGPLHETAEPRPPTPDWPIVTRPAGLSPSAEMAAEFLALVRKGDIDPRVCHGCGDWAPPELHYTCPCICHRAERFLETGSLTR